MEQLIFHLFGDYVTQSNWMAQNKTKAHWPALAHAVVYACPFAWICPTMDAWLVILLTHFLIDRYRLAVYLVWFKNWFFDYSFEERVPFSECRKTGYPSTHPDWLAVWLLIAADNTVHLAINYAAIRWVV